LLVKLIRKTFRVELIRDINRFIREQGCEKQVVFVPNYDIHVARLLVAGCDVLNTVARRSFTAQAA